MDYIVTWMHECIKMDFGVIEIKYAQMMVSTLYNSMEVHWLLLSGYIGRIASENNTVFSIDKVLYMYMHTCI